METFTSCLKVKASAGVKEAVLGAIDELCIGDLTPKDAAKRLMELMQGSTLGWLSILTPACMLPWNIASVAPGFEPCRKKIEHQDIPGFEPGQTPSDGLTYYLRSFFMCTTALNCHSSMTLQFLTMVQRDPLDHAAEVHCTCFSL